MSRTARLEWSCSCDLDEALSGGMNGLASQSDTATFPSALKLHLQFGTLQGLERPNLSEGRRFACSARNGEWPSLVHATPFQRLG